MPGCPIRTAGWGSTSPRLYDLVEDNVIVASDTGIDILAPAGNTSITGNILGANSSDLRRQLPVPGQLTGIEVSTSDNTIGGAIGSTMSGTVSGAPINGETLLGPGNVIAYSETAGISIAAAQNVVQGDFVGTDLAGDDLMKGTAGAGIILDAAGETIGGTNTLTRPDCGRAAIHHPVGRERDRLHRDRGGGHLDLGYRDRLRFGDRQLRRRRSHQSQDQRRQCDRDRDRLERRREYDRRAAVSGRTRASPAPRRTSSDSTSTGIQISGPGATSMSSRRITSGRNREGTTSATR